MDFSPVLEWVRFALIIVVAMIDPDSRVVMQVIGGTELPCVVVSTGSGNPGTQLGKMGELTY